MRQKIIKESNIILQKLQERFSDHEIEYEKLDESVFIWLDGKKLKVQWTPDLESDLNYYGLNVKQELYSLLVEFIEREIENETKDN